MSRSFLDGKDRYLRPLALGSLLVAAVLLLWPIYPPEPLWNLLVGWGFGPFVSGDIVVVTPISALISGGSLGDGGDRLQLAAGLLLAGIGIGAALAVDRWRYGRRFRPPTRRTPVDEMRVLGDRAGHQP